MRKELDLDRLESLLRQQMAQEGKTPEEIESAVMELRSVAYRVPALVTGPRYEYRSQATLFGLPWIHVVIGRDPATGRIGKAVGVLAIGRMAFGLVPIGQIAIGVVPIGQLAVGLLFAIGQGAFSGYDAVGQLAVSSHFALGQFAAAASAIGQLAVGRYVLAQLGWGRHVWSTKIRDPEALDHFREMFRWLLEILE